MKLELNSVEEIREFIQMIQGLNTPQQKTTPKKIGRPPKKRTPETEFFQDIPKKELV